MSFANRISSRGPLQIEDSSWVFYTYKTLHGSSTRIIPRGVLHKEDVFHASRTSHRCSAYRSPSRGHLHLKNLRKVFYKYKAIHRSSTHRIHSNAFCTHNPFQRTSTPKRPSGDLLHITDFLEVCFI